MVSHPHPQSIGRWRRIWLLIIRWLISTLAIFGAVILVPGVDFVGPGWQLGIVAMVFGLVNVALRPILLPLTCPLVILTLGLFSLAINAVLLLLTAEIATSLGVQFTVDGFWPAVGGALVISIVSLLLNLLTQDTQQSRVVVVQYRRKDEDKEP